MLLLTRVAFHCLQVGKRRRDIKLVFYTNRIVLQLQRHVARIFPGPAFSIAASTTIQPPDACIHVGFIQKPATIWEKNIRRFRIRWSIKHFLRLRDL